jgi:hypothetical protein
MFCSGTPQGKMASLSLCFASISHAEYIKFLGLIHRVWSIHASRQMDESYTSLYNTLYLFSVSRHIQKYISTSTDGFQHLCFHLVFYIYTIYKLSSVRKYLFLFTKDTVTYLFICSIYLYIYIYRKTPTK